MECCTPELYVSLVLYDATREKKTERIIIPERFSPLLEIREIFGILLPHILRAFVEENSEAVKLLDSILPIRTAGDFREQLSNITDVDISANRKCVSPDKFADVINEVLSYFDSHLIPVHTQSFNAFINQEGFCEVHYDSVSNQENKPSSGIFCHRSFTLPSSANHQLIVYVKCIQTPESSFQGVTESSENDDILLGECDIALHELRECPAFHESHQSDNDKCHGNKDIIDWPGYCQINIQKSFEEIQQQEEKVEDEHQGNIMDTNKEILLQHKEKLHQQDKIVGKNPPLCRRNCRKKCFVVKQFKISRFTFILVHLKAYIWETDNSDVQRCDESKSTEKTNCGVKTWKKVFFKKKRKKKLNFHGWKCRRARRKATGRLSFKTTKSQLFLDVKKEKVLLTRNLVNVHNEKSDRDSTLLDNTVKKCNTSRQFHELKAGVGDVKTSEHADLRTSVSEEGLLCLDVLRDLGLIFKFSLSGHMFWQEAMVYPVNRHEPNVNTPQDDPHQLMHYEIFRLCSFSYTRFPADFDVWVTRLAQAGFYCENENGRIICFYCGQEFRGAMNTTIENAHLPGCRHHQHSRPLQMWTQGLNQEVLAIYYTRYGSLRPYNFEISNPVGMALEHVDGSHRVSDSSDLRVPEPQTHQNNVHASGGTPLRRGSDIPALADREESDLRDDVRPHYHSQTLPLVTDETSHDYPFGNQRHSLPGNLNDVSGVLVSEESRDPPGSHQVLTSAARNPMPFYSVPSRGSQSQQGEGGSENGAVGGADPTLDLSKASYPLFSSAEARRQTYTTWNPAHSHRPEDLVAAGFFYAVSTGWHTCPTVFRRIYDMPGYADCVRCFYCGLGLKYWRVTDIPAYQHARYRPHCVYNRLYKGQDYIDRVQQDLQAEQGVNNQATNQALPRPQERREVAAEPVASEPLAAPVTVQSEVTPVTVAPPATAQVPDLMNSAVAQEALRNGWQRDQVQQAIDQIVRELGENCLEIGILLDVLLTLNNPEENLPSGDSLNSGDSGINENAVAPISVASVREPATENLNVADGGREVEFPDSAQEVGAQPPVRATPIQQPSAPNLAFLDIFTSVEREHTLLAERTRCRLCRIRQVSCIYLPCGHVIACQECADSATHCVLCSRQIVGTANIYLA